jgi:hypothetical protein
MDAVQSDGGESGDDATGQGCGGIDAYVKDRTAHLTTDYEEAKEWQKERATLKGQMEQQELRRQREVLERAIRAEAKKLDVQPASGGRHCPLPAQPYSR